MNSLYKFQHKRLREPQIIQGCNDNFLTAPIQNSFDLYIKVKRFLHDNSKFINIKTGALGIPMDIDSNTNKVVTISEYISKLSGSIFDLIYRLKNKDVEIDNHFKTIGEALSHEWIKKIDIPQIRNKEERGLNALRSSPADI